MANKVIFLVSSVYISILLWVDGTHEILFIRDDVFYACQNLWSFHPTKVEGMSNAMIERIKNGDEEALVEVYAQYRNEFIGWAIKTYPSCNEEDAKDIFQDVMIKFRTNVITGSLQEISHNLKTYLFDIGKKMIINRFNQGKRRSELLVENKDRITPHESEGNPMENKERVNIVADLLNELDDKCRELLKQAFWADQSGDEIAKNLGLKDRKVVAVKKRKCINKLVNLLGDRTDLKALYTS